MWWLTTLPITDHKFSMPKGEFRNVLFLHFGCPYCHHLSICRNELRNLTAVSEVCTDVGIEPPKVLLFKN